MHLKPENLLSALVGDPKTVDHAFLCAYTLYNISF